MAVIWDIIPLKKSMLTRLLSIFKINVDTDDRSIYSAPIKQQELPMPAFNVYFRRLNETKGKFAVGPFNTKAEASAFAIRANSKPFTPFFYYVIEE